ncbi:MAG: hypothetical protein KJ970_12005 [Candidatus Eisenbacteria bacterium]|uniref:Hint domain-containing protein n=1 Tax=Eiseniibacteriota bacterium TaxID=2212470 RepID=A0A948RV83_UNCEI|nr:hypothetical protein [Candidatus Eisenbacteria bacterium]
MRSIVMLMILGVLAVTGAAQAIPYCHQVDLGTFCIGGEGCTTHRIEFGSCIDEIKLFRCVWYGGCTPFEGNWQPCDCSSTGNPGNGCDCLLGGTPIRMADGSTKPVEQIQVGDRVLAYDEPTARMSMSEVTSIHKPYVVTHYFIINEELSATENHPVLSGGKWVNVSNLSVGDVLTSPDGWDMEIFALRKIEEEVKVYNFQVKAGTYVANDIIVHNKEDCEAYAQYYPY